MRSPHASTRATGATLVVALLALAIPSATSAATAAQLIAALNAQRAANGIPAGIKQSRSASTGCAAHNRYERLNGGALTHTETRGKRGYSRAGARAAATSVLAAGSALNSADPWDSAPIHLAQLLDPELDRMGASESGGLACATTLPPSAGFRRGPSAPVGYSYPGNGRTGWPTQEQAAEGPFTPGDLVGLRQPKVTGPYLYVLFSGPWSPFGPQVKLASASVTGPQGPIAIKVADGTVKTPVGVRLSAFIGAEAMLIPVSPLAPSTRYSVSTRGTVTANGKSWGVKTRFSFTTGS